MNCRCSIIVQSYKRKRVNVYTHIKIEPKSIDLLLSTRKNWVELLLLELCKSFIFIHVISPSSSSAVVVYFIMQWRAYSLCAKIYRKIHLHRRQENVMRGIGEVRCVWIHLCDLLQIQFVSKWPGEWRNNRLPDTWSQHMPAVMVV